MLSGTDSVIVIYNRLLRTHDSNVCWAANFPNWVEERPLRGLLAYLRGMCPPPCPLVKLFQTKLSRLERIIYPFKPRIFALDLKEYKQGEISYIWALFGESITSMQFV